MHAPTPGSKGAEPPTYIEALFGETTHQADPYRRITFNFLLVCGMSFIAQGTYDEGYWNGVRFYMYEIGEDAASVATLNLLSWLPWIPKIAYAALSDMVPLFGYQRKYYIFFGSLFTGLASLIAGWRGTTFASQALWMIIGQICAATTNVAIDALLVERCQNKNAYVAGRLMAFTKCAYIVGMVASDALFGFLIDWYHPRVCYYLFAGFQVLVAVCILSLKVLFEILSFFQAGFSSSPRQTLGDFLNIIFLDLCASGAAEVGGSVCCART